MPDSAPPRVAVLIDYRFRRAGGRVTTERAFALFLLALRPHLARLVLVGRLDPAQEPYPYEVPADVELAALPFYASLARPAALLRALRGLRPMWRALDDVEVAWALGPNPAAILFAVLGLVRRRRVVLGVRQDLRAYARRRHPGRRGLHLAADAMEAAFRALARRCPVAAVGADLARRYARARAVHVLHVSLVSATQLVAAREDRFAGRLLTVGRLDEEKNPLLLAELMAQLPADWTLDVYGDGPLAVALAERARALGVEGRLALHGYVAADDGLRDAYRSADAFVHVSWTEGMPQVLLEAFAARLPTVATDVGGVAALAADAALLVPPGDAAAAAAALARVAADPALRARLADAAGRVAAAHTLEAEAAALAGFLAGP
jgi:glycosyltransferase involved in cell wall biosynthesis